MSDSDVAQLLLNRPPFTKEVSDTKVQNTICNPQVFMPERERIFFNMVTALLEIKI